jgi:predicted transcriptional regulator
VPARDPWPAFDREIERIRERLDLPEPFVPYEGPDDAEQVQLSVRIPPRLKHDVAQVAKRRRQTVTAFVTEALADAVRTEQDPFAGLAANMTARFRERLGAAVASGAYAEAAADVDDEEGWADTA